MALFPIRYGAGIMVGQKSAFPNRCASTAAKVEVCEGEGADITTKQYSTYCPKAFGLIGKLTPTLMDRSIEIRMQRKLREKVEPLASPQDSSLR